MPMLLQWQVMLTVVYSWLLTYFLG
jgi:hypothetical protein